MTENRCTLDRLEQYCLEGRIGLLRYFEHVVNGTLPECHLERGMELLLLQHVCSNQHGSSCFVLFVPSCVQSLLCRYFIEADIPVLLTLFREEIALWGLYALFTSRPAIFFYSLIADDGDERSQGHGQHQLSLLICCSFHQCPLIGSPKRVGTLFRLTIKANVACVYMQLQGDQTLITICLSTTHSCCIVFIMYSYLNDTLVVCHLLRMTEGQYQAHVVKQSQFQTH